MKIGQLYRYPLEWDIYHFLKTMEKGREMKFHSSDVLLLLNVIPYDPEDPTHHTKKIVFLTKYGICYRFVSDFYYEEISKE